MWYDDITQHLMTMNTPQSVFIASDDSELFQQGQSSSALLTSVHQEDDFIDLFHMYANHFQCLNGSLVLRQSLKMLQTNVLKHVVQHNWMAAAKVVLDQFDQFETHLAEQKDKNHQWGGKFHPNSTVWMDALMGVSSTKMLDVFLAWDFVPHYEDWIEEFAKNTTPDLFGYCFEHEQREQRDPSFSSATVSRLARRGFVEHIRIIWDHLEEDHFEDGLFWACYHKQEHVIELLYNEERGKRARDNAIQHNYWSADPRLGWGLLDVLMQRDAQRQEMTAEVEHVASSRSDRVKKL